MLSLKEYKEEYGLFTNMVLCVTNDCNLRCRYCFVEQKPDYMTLEVAKTAVDFLMNNLKRKRELKNNSNLKASLSFFGGEPTLMWDTIIVPTVEYIEEKYPNDIMLGITTNGTLLNKEKIDYLFEHKIYPLLSIDGDKETQDYNRPCKDCKLSSFDLVSKNIPYLLEKFPNTTFRMTIYEDTCNKLFDNILYAEKMGFNNFVSCIDSRSTFSEKSYNILSQELEKYALYLYGSLQNNINVIRNDAFESALIRELDLIANTKIEKNFLFIKEIFRCGLGTLSVSVSPTGQIIGCQEQSSKISNDNIFYIGDIFNGIDKERHMNLIYNYRSFIPSICEDKQECFNCPISYHCRDIHCPSASYQRFNNFYTISKNECKWRKILHNICNEMLKIQNEPFEKYLDIIISKREGK